MPAMTGMRRIIGALYVIRSVIMSYEALAQTSGTACAWPLHWRIFDDHSGAKLVNH